MAATNKNVFWQAIRGICMLAVVLIHCENGVGLPLTSFEGAWYLLMRNLINFPVAIFFFVSGYFVRMPEPTAGAYLKKRLPRLLIPYVVYTVGYLLFSFLTGGELSVGRLLKAFLLGKAATPFYYIVVLTLFTLVTPLLMRCVRHRGKSIFILSLTPVFLLLYNVAPALGFDLDGIIRYTPVWIAFYYGGMLVNEYRPTVRCSDKLIVGGVIAAFMLQLLESVFFSTFGQIRLGGFLYAAALILLIYRYSDTDWSNNRLMNWLGFIGDRSYGIFYLHCAVLTVVNIVLSRIGVDLFLPVLQLVQWTVAVAGSIGIIYLIRLVLPKKTASFVFGV